MNAAAIEILIGKGLTGQDLLEVARALESNQGRSPAAVRQARYREKKRESVTGDTTSDVTPPLKDNSKPPSVSGETAAKPLDPAKQLFDLGVEILTGADHTAAQARSLIGKWRKSHGDGKTLEALLDCRAKAITNPVEWMPKRLGSAEPNITDFATAAAQRAKNYEQSQTASAR